MRAEKFGWRYKQANAQIGEIQGHDKPVGQDAPKLAPRYEEEYQRCVPKDREEDQEHSHGPVPAGHGGIVLVKLLQYRL